MQLAEAIAKVKSNGVIMLDNNKVGFEDNVKALLEFNPTKRKRIYHIRYNPDTKSHSKHDVRHCLIGTAKMDKVYGFIQESIITYFDDVTPDAKVKTITLVGIKDKVLQEK